MASTSKKSRPSEPTSLENITLTWNNQLTPELYTEQIKNYFSTAIQPVRYNWKFSDVKHQLFKDGVTNQLIVFWNFKIDSFDLKDCKDAIVLRINGKFTENFIDRDREKSYWVMLSNLNVSGVLYATFENGVVYQYQPGKSLRGLLQVVIFFHRSVLNHQILSSSLTKHF